VAMMKTDRNKSGTCTGAYFLYFFCSRPTNPCEQACEHTQEAARFRAEGLFESIDQRVQQRVS
jgi:hypothetical protein